jgi:hypothetical protein
MSHTIVGCFWILCGLATIIWSRRWAEWGVHPWKRVRWAPAFVLRTEFHRAVSIIEGIAVLVIGLFMLSG